MPDAEVQLIKVFPAGAKGGNPAPIVLDAAGMSDDAMREVAARFGHESGFVFPPSPAADAEFGMRFFVPLHEMEMCGHATVGALWLLRRAGRWTSDATTVETASGLVRGVVRHAGTAVEYVEITQPPGSLRAIDNPDRVAEIADVLCVHGDQLLPVPVFNAATSRIKTLIGVKSVEILDGLQPDFSRVQALCESIGSTGLYPFATGSKEQRIFHARQFPRSSGYPEDAATGIAAAALLFGLKAHGLVPADGEVVTVHQGRAMGSPSEIRVRFDIGSKGEVAGCFVGGAVSR